ncbi:MAG: hypothetical protein Q7U98_13260 [Methylicorpusculum sp.]|uniref:hypothetical protein n=1 Tax=Methylicorpusculum sp. TaxID=2713644 RepID=UPI002723E1F5|nr:hypothetical protein [Methylicorpusculum sp.]MDO8940117.1 hypothetical protein [Methylicorpusculum sp.]MDO9238904.1 hypothetical protein [Methylicorpusculum sp.]MDP2201110.1 hypothetical protein [Methylicorpusculum sp.]
MNISPTTHALNLINTAQHKASEATQTIASMPMKANEVGSTNYQSTDLIKPIISLKEAELETAAATKIITHDKKMLGSLLDIKA